MTRTKYSDEFKEQVVREILEKERTIASVAASYDLVPQTVGVRGRPGAGGGTPRPRTPKPPPNRPRSPGRGAEKRGAAGGERVLEKRCATRAGGLMRV